VPLPRSPSPAFGATGFFGALLSGAVLAATAAPAGAVEIQPHRAIYALDLASARASSQVTDVDGRMMFSWEDGCDGWTIEQRYLMTFLYAQGPEVEQQITYTSFESKDGTRFDFTFRSARNGEVLEEFRGSAELDAPGGTGTATYRLPEDSTQDLPADTWFPTAHTLELIRAAEAGRPFFAAHLFDGSGEAGLAFVNAFIAGTADPVTGADEAIDAALLDGTAYDVQMTFFTLPGDQSVPDYEMAVVLHANGIVDDMMIDYGDFALSAELEDLEALDVATCD
jgi:hypothetical protein